MALLRLAGVIKRYGGVAALSDVDLAVEPGEVVGLIGENGAGKSTLIKIVAGAVRPDAGEMRVDDRPVAFRTPRDAIAAGIAVIYQELTTCPDLDAVENVLLGKLPARGALVDWPAARREAARWLSELAADTPLDVPLREMSVGMQQLVEIARALSRKSRLIFMDEPTASLSRRETERLLDIVRDLRRRDVAVVFVTHRLEEAFAVTDRLVVLRDGRKVGEIPTTEATPDEVIRLMVGRALSRQFPPREHAGEPEVVLEAHHLTAAGRFRDVSLAVHKGEVVGLAGLVGAGRTSLLRAIFGAARVDSGELHLAGEHVAIGSPRDAIHLGMGFVPEDRKEQGLILNMAVAENIALASFDHLARVGVLPYSRVRAFALAHAKALDIRMRSIDQEAQTLSGGNQQKVVLARWLALEPRVLLLDEPTRGVDVGAKAEIYRLIRDLADRGLAILLATSELPELIALSDRIIVLRNGEAVGELSAGPSQEEVMRLATGTKTPVLGAPA